MEWWQIVLAIIAAILVGVTAGILVFYLYFRLVKEPGVSLIYFLTLFFMPKTARKSMVVGGQPSLILRKLLPEVEHNQQIATEPLKEGLQVMETQVWDALQSDINKLPEQLLSEMLQVYSDIRMVNSLVELSVELGYRTPDLEDNYIDLCDGISKRLGGVIDLARGAGLSSEKYKDVRKESSQAVEEPAKKAIGEAEGSDRPAGEQVEGEVEVVEVQVKQQAREVMEEMKVAEQVVMNEARSEAKEAEMKTKQEAEEARRAREREKEIERITKERAKREAEEAAIRSRQQAEAAREREKAAEQAAKEQAKQEAKEAKEREKAAREQAKQEAKEAKEREKVTREQAKQEAKEAKEKGKAVEPVVIEPVGSEAEKVTIVAEQRVEEAKAGEEVAEPVTSEAEKVEIVAEEKVGEAEVSEEAAEPVGSEAEKVEIVAEQRVEEAEVREEAVGPMKGEAEKVEIIAETVEKTPAHLYEGRITLAIVLPVDFGRLRMLERGLREMEGLRVVAVGGSAGKGTTIIVDIENPMPLDRVLRELPYIEQVTRDGDGIQVKLHVA